MNNLDFRLPSVFLSCWSALNFAQFKTCSTIEDFATRNKVGSKVQTMVTGYVLFFKKSSDRVGFEPNLLAGSVNVSFV